MRKIKKICVMSMCITLAFTMIACGSNQTGSLSKDSNTEATKSVGNTPDKQTLSVDISNATLSNASDSNVTSSSEVEQEGTNVMTSSETMTDGSQTDTSQDKVVETNSLLGDITFPTIETSTSLVELSKIPDSNSQNNSNSAETETTNNDKNTEKSPIQTELTYMMPGILSTVKFGMSLSEVENILQGQYESSVYLENIYGTTISVPSIELTDSTIFGDSATIELIFEEQLGASRLVRISLLFPTELNKKEVIEDLLKRTFGSVGMVANTPDYYTSNTFLNNLSNSMIEGLETIYGISKENQFNINNNSSSAWIEDLKNRLSSTPLYSVNISYVHNIRYELVVDGEYLSYLYLIKNDEISNYFAKLEAENNKVIPDEPITYHSDDMNYSLTLPSEWYEDYIVVKGNDNSESFYEKNNYEYGKVYGYLFSIEYEDETSNYTDFPSYKVLGTTGNMTAVMVLPTDVGFDAYNQKRMDSYRKLFAGIDSIAASFRFE